MASGLGDGVGVDLLSEGDERALSGLSDLLEHVLDGGFVAHDGDGGYLLQGDKVASLDLTAGLEDISDGLVGGSINLKLLKA